MERKFLEELGLDKEVIEKIMAQHGKTVESHKTAAENAVKDRDTYKGQLEDVSKKLKAFDGVDVEALRGEVETLKKDIATKESDFQGQLADRDFQAMLNAEIMAAKGKNPKAVMSLLDMDTLKASKNQKEDTAAAVKALLETDAYLFGETSETTAAKVKTGGEHTETNNTDSDPFVAAAMKGAGLDTGKDG
jgi:hypothetical protein